MVSRMRILTAAIGIAILYISLPLVVLLPLNAAGFEGDSCRVANNFPARVSKVEIVKNIVVRQFAEHEPRSTGYYKRDLLLKPRLLHSEARLSWPYCGRSRKWIGGTPSKHGIFGFVQSPTHRTDIDDETVMWSSSWSEPVVLETVTEYSVCGNCVNADIAFGILGC